MRIFCIGFRRVNCTAWFAVNGFAVFRAAGVIPSSSSTLWPDTQTSARQRVGLISVESLADVACVMSDKCRLGMRGFVYTYEGSETKICT
jgi:hypothetical protein